MHTECQSRLKLQRLSKEEKKELFSTIRYSYMSHEDLLVLTADPVFEQAKDFIVEGLSAKLNTFENAIKKELSINLEPRTNFDPSKVQDPSDPLAQANQSRQQQLGGTQQQPSNPFLKKPMYENYYERKLHDLPKEYTTFSNKLTLNPLQRGPQKLMSPPNTNPTPRPD